MAQQDPGDRLTRRSQPRRLALVLAGICAAGAVGGASAGVLGCAHGAALPRIPALDTSAPAASPSPTATPPARAQIATPTPTQTPSRRPSPAPVRPTQLRVVALGDSVTDGTNCGCVPFPELYAAALRDRYRVPVHITNDGLAGATSADVVAGLEGNQDVGAADVVLVTIGANDFSDVSGDVLAMTCGGSDDLACTQDRLTELQQNLRRILTRIAARDSAHPRTVLLTGYWNVYEDGNVADADYSSAGRAASIALTRKVNHVVQAIADHEQATYVDLFAPFKGADGDQDATPLLADDGDHPNAAGHRIIARALLAAGLIGEPARPH